MMNSFYFEPKDIFPRIILDQQKGKFEISGKSIPEDVDAFYQPVLSWLANYIENPNSHTRFVFRLDYFNSATVRKFVDILELLEILRKQSKGVEVLWLYEEGDEIIRDSGEDLRNAIQVQMVVRMVTPADYSSL